MFELKFTLEGVDAQGNEAIGGAPDHYRCRIAVMNPEPHPNIDGNKGDPYTVRLVLLDSSSTDPVALYAGVEPKHRIAATIRQGRFYAVRVPDNMSLWIRSKSPATVTIGIM